MRRGCVALMMGVLLLITGCAVEKTQESPAVKFANADTFSITGDISVDYGDRVSSFTLNYKGDCESGTITVIKPESIAGVQLDIKDGSVMMKFGDVLLDSGKISNGLTPISAIPTLANALKNGYLTESGIDKIGEIECTRFIYQPSDSENENMLCSVWVSNTTYQPVYGEISIGGEVLVKCTFSEFAASTHTELEQD